MSKAITPPPRRSHDGNLADDLDTELENVTVELGHAGESIHDYVEDVLESFDRPEVGKKPSATHALRTIVAHPFATVAAVATIISALVGMALTQRRGKIHSGS